MKLEPSAAYIKSLQLWDHLMNKGVPFKRRGQKVSLLTYEVDDIDSLDDILYRADYAYVDSAAFYGLTNPAKLLVTRIIVELADGNPFWQFDHRENSRTSGYISELRKHEILFKTGTTDIHLVNPFKLRKGKLPRVLAIAIQLSKGSAKITTDHLGAKKLKGKLSIDPADFLKYT